MQFYHRFHGCTWMFQRENTFGQDNWILLGRQNRFSFRLHPLQLPESRWGRKD